jgi:hypothetical protein
LIDSTVIVSHLSRDRAGFAIEPGAAYLAHAASA